MLTFLYHLVTVVVVLLGALSLLATDRMANDILNREEVGHAVEGYTYTRVVGFVLFDVFCVAWVAAALWQ